MVIGLVVLRVEPAGPTVGMRQSVTLFLPLSFFSKNILALLAALGRFGQNLPILIPTTLGPDRNYYSWDPKVVVSVGTKSRECGSVPLGESQAGLSKTRLGVGRNCYFWIPEVVVLSDTKSWFWKPAPSGSRMGPGMYPFRDPFRDPFWNRLGPVFKTMTWCRMKR